MMQGRWRDEGAGGYSDMRWRDKAAGRYTDMM